MAPKYKHTLGIMFPHDMIITDKTHAMFCQLSPCIDQDDNILEDVWGHVGETFSVIGYPMDPLLKIITKYIFNDCELDVVIVKYNNSLYWMSTEDLQCGTLSIMEI